jgi:hypothetical protein
LAASCTPTGAGVGEGVAVAAGEGVAVAAGGGVAVAAGEGTTDAEGAGTLVAVWVSSGLVVVEGAPVAGRVGEAVGTGLPDKAVDAPSSPLPDATKMTAAITATIRTAPLAAYRRLGLSIDPPGPNVATRDECEAPRRRQCNVGSCNAGR